MTTAAMPGSAGRADRTPPWKRTLLAPTLTKQCWGFMIGSTLFGLGSAPWLGIWMGAANANICYFIGAWFFTGAGLVQVINSGAVSVAVDYPPGRMVRAEWLAASTQSFGTLLFNVSTTSAVAAHTLAAEKHLVWSPDAGGSVAFLISGVFVIVAYSHDNRLWNPTDVAWWAGQVNMLGCIAFGVSAVGAYITPDGNTVDDVLANTGTFVGAVCFFVASLIVLPMWSTRARDRQRVR
ncbi:hypothetical protein [Gordonia polyisoprenivorans]|uniref:hypothetical protein n=1 Tax=Gordonia polyisoprenivorans TaxID=84595 RepID=UPI002301C61D|nr:hypothetical protein [Gordonia polyisoprenivorans]WCB35966.1 hypothetical protein PHA63_17990 [Gordonia polyisoprenivorans]